MDKMPDEIYTNGRSVYKNGDVAYSANPDGVMLVKDAWECKKYRRADLPKEVDLRSLYLNEQAGGVAVALAQGVKCAASYNKAIDQLVALGVIKDKGV